MNQCAPWQSETRNDRSCRSTVARERWSVGFLFFKDPFVCPKNQGLGPLHSYSKDGIGTQKILFDREESGFLGLRKKSRDKDEKLELNKNKCISRRRLNSPI